MLVNHQMMCDPGTLTRDNRKLHSASSSECLRRPGHTIYARGKPSVALLSTLSTLSSAFDESAPTLVLVPHVAGLQDKLYRRCRRCWRRRGGSRMLGLSGSS